MGQNCLLFDITHSWSVRNYIKANTEDKDHEWRMIIRMYDIFKEVPEERIFEELTRMGIPTADAQKISNYDRESERQAFITFLNLKQS